MRHNQFLVFIAICIGALGLAPAASVSAKPTALNININIDRSDDAGGLACDSSNFSDCTLRSAIEKANAAFAADDEIGDITIYFDQNRTVNLTSELPELTADHVFIRPTVLGNLKLTIDGNNSILTGLTISGGDILLDDVVMRDFSFLPYLHKRDRLRS